MKCGCGDTAVGKMNTRLTIEENTNTTQNSRGGITPDWDPIGTSPHVWTSYTQGGGRELWSAQQVRAEVTGIVKLRFRSDLTPRNRFRVKGTSRLLEIITVFDPDQSRQWLTCWVKETV